MDGYGHKDYAASLSELGTPRLLPRIGGWVIQRPIEGFSCQDAMGCYPLFVCDDWSKLEADLNDMGNSLVCISLVADPFGDYDSALLRRLFHDVVVPFKQHFVVDLTREPETFIHPHHRRNARKALRDLEVEECTEPWRLLNDWTCLYENLVRRHGITGFSAFSRATFERQLTVPGISAFRAMRNNFTTGMVLWYIQGNRAYYHLGAYNSEGYELRASFALFHYAIEHFARQGLQWLILGGEPGVEAGGNAGLKRFKQGWSTGVRTAYFCGRIFQPEKYEEIVRAKGIASAAYFPAYRAGELIERPVRTA